MGSKRLKRLQRRCGPEKTKMEKKTDRREFLKVTMGAFLGGTLFSCSLSDLKNPKTMVKTPIKTNILRPPGAVPEEYFAQKCIRCGRCGEVCPYHCIKYFDVINGGVFSGTPYIDVMEVPCYLCMKCVYVCPTGSLVPCAKEKVRMGVAVINRQICVTWQQDKTGLMCKTCFNVCPFSGVAIKIDHDFRPYIVEENCTGCGICVYSCIADQYPENNGKKAITIEPIKWKKIKKIKLEDIKKS
jgi:ferredoxin-type protein NapG